jgi:hypothetical protein
MLHGTANGQPVEPVKKKHRTEAKVVTEDI